MANAEQRNSFMTGEILVEIDEEISRLKQVRALLSINEAKAITAKAATRKPKWKMSIEARKKIADAQRRRWAKQRSENRAEAGIISE